MSRMSVEGMKRLLWIFCVLLSALPLLFAGAEDDASTENGIEKQRGGGKEEGRQLPCEILVKHPGNGSAMAFGSDEARAMVVVSLYGTQGKAVRIDVDAIEWAQLPPGAVEGVDHVADLGMWDSGIHLIEVFWIEDQDNDPRGLLATSVEILVYHSRDGRLPGESNLKDARDARDDSSGFFRCPFAFEPFASKTGWDWDWDSDSDSNSVVQVSKREDIGFGRGKWHEYRACLSVWMELHPHSSAGLYELGKLAEAHGDWNDAIALYRQAMDLGWTNMDGRLAELTQLAADDLIRNRRACTWNSSEESAELGWGLGPEEAMQSQGDVNGDGDGDADAGACHGGQQGRHKSTDYSKHQLYLSVILVGRHDNTHFCQVTVFHTGSKHNLLERWKLSHDFFPFVLTFHMHQFAVPARRLHGPPAGLTFCPHLPLGKEWAVRRFRDYLGRVQPVHGKRIEGGGLL